MIKNLNADKLINSELFIREPVEDICKKIEKCDSSKIILTGGRGVGKSVVLRNKEKGDLFKNDKSIYMWFDPCSRFGDKNCRYDEKFIINYYELLFSNNLLHHIKKNYELTYNKYFREKHSELMNKIKDMDTYMNEIFIENDFKNHLALGDFSYHIIEELKKVLEVNSLTLMIERFDSIDGCSEISQKILSNYFGMFDKTVLATSDDELKKDNRSNIILDDTYEFLDVNYGTDSNVVKEILRKRLVSHNEGIDLEREKIISLDAITDDVYKYLADNCNGDIKVMISVLREIISLYWWHSGNYNIEQNVSNLCEEQLQKVKALNEMNASYPPHLYL